MYIDQILCSYRLVLERHTVFISKSFSWYCWSLFQNGLGFKKILEHGCARIVGLEIPELVSLKQILNRKGLVFGVSWSPRTAESISADPGEWLCWNVQTDKSGP